MNLLLEMKKLKWAMTEEVEKEQKLRVNALLNDLEDATPVDTGRARNSWTASVVRPGVIKVTNHAPYIQYLNEGSSKQAPAHFIEQTAMKHGKPLGAIVEVKE